MTPHQQFLHDDAELDRVADERAARIVIGIDPTSGPDITVFHDRKGREFTPAEVDAIREAIEKESQLPSEVSPETPSTPFD